MVKLNLNREQGTGNSECVIRLRKAGLLKERKWFRPQPLPNVRRTQDREQAISPFGILSIAFCFLPLNSMTAVLAASPRDIAQQAKAVTVRIVAQDYSQTGVLVGQEGDTYWVLTCKSSPGAEIRLGDNQSYKILDSQTLSQADSSLTVLTFASANAYTPARLGDSQALAVGDRIYLAGFLDENTNSDSSFQFTEGIISSLTNSSRQAGDGFTHTSLSYAGMEGSPIFDHEGELIGIHCGSEAPLASQSSRTALNWGIAINSFRDFAQKQGLPLGFSAFGSPPPYRLP